MKLTEMPQMTVCKETNRVYTCQDPTNQCGMSRSHFYVVASVPAIPQRLAGSLISASITLDREPHRNFHSAVSLKLGVLLFPTVNSQCCVLFAAAFIGHHLFD